MHNTEPKNLSDPIQFEKENNIQLIVYFTNKQMSFFLFFIFCPLRFTSLLTCPSLICAVIM